MAEDKLSAAPSPPPPYDEAPNKHILRQTICIELLLALQLCNTVFTCEVLDQQHGAVVCNIIFRMKVTPSPSQAGKLISGW